MDINDVKKTICGPMIPVITNLNKDLSVDHAGIRNEVQYLIEHGIQKGRGVLIAAGATIPYRAWHSERSWCSNRRGSRR